MHIGTRNIQYTYKMNGQVLQHAVDTNLFISGTDEAKLRNKCSTCLAALNSWFIANRLCINLDSRQNKYNDFSF